ncbi:ATP-grasp fold amidoligase family protein [Aestuariicoccus sp. MJ-SS9]|uniref:ATP-grasp fold amidoligase family protein n=1 Tax=Aestuariicoccus sp. MJ-SS9 TaxID=3079855 RepID=UPI00290F7F46|nr:ATP-grasp fold amidoligase family protein [Aestuariicoccus sp. MJ-SS9]MDU8912812.1 ATP-grasp fold amidoligase family protein [Aestuariicoccus sp. MJ-SS9]
MSAHLRSVFEVLPTALRSRWRLRASGVEIGDQTVRLAPRLDALVLVERGRRLLAEGRRIEALKVFAAALERDPGVVLLDWGLPMPPGAGGIAPLEWRMKVRWREFYEAAKDSPAGRLRAMPTKSDFRKWIVEQGVPVSRLIATAETVRALDFDALPRRYIIKPADASSSKGVFRVDGSEVRTLAGWRHLEGKSVAAIVRRRYAEVGLGKQEVLVEEAERDVTDPTLEIPRDVKIFAARGRATFVQVLDRNGPEGRKGMATVARDWSRLPASATWPELESEPKPKGFDEAIALAERLSLAFPMLLRWDFFLTPEGPKFCELTRFPNAGKGFQPWMERAIFQLMELDSLC